MRSYLILKSKVERFHNDADIQALIADLRARDSWYDGPGASDGYNQKAAAGLKERRFDLEALAGRGRRYEELDQLVMELLLGAR